MATLCCVWSFVLAAQKRDDPRMCTVHRGSAGLWAFSFSFGMKDCPWATASSSGYGLDDSLYQDKIRAKSDPPYENSRKTRAGMVPALLVGGQTHFKFSILCAAASSGRSLSPVL